MKPSVTLERLTRLRDLLRARQLQAYLLPSEDEHFNEYVDAADRRFTFLSGFTGSVCTTIITLDKAALWTDGRYHVQALTELDDNWSLMRKGYPDVPTEIKWLVSVTPPGSRIGYDARQIPFTQLELYRRELYEAEASQGLFPDWDGQTNSLNRQLIDLPGENLVDLVWDAMSSDDTQGQYPRPARSCNPIRILPLAFVGMKWQDKISKVRSMMVEKGASLLVCSLLDEIAWLFNLRGSDIRFNPVFYAYLLLGLDEVHLFLNPQTVQSTPELLTHLNDSSIQVSIHPYSEFLNFLETSVQKLNSNQSRVWLDLTASQAMVARVPKSNRLIYASPLASLKSVKLSTELDGIRKAHIVDSLVLCDFLAWLEQVAEFDRQRSSTDSKNSDSSQPINSLECEPAGQPSICPPDQLTEYSLATYLNQLRSQAEEFVSLSFETISCADSNCAVVHHHPSPDQHVPVTKQSIYLVDSGGQYQTGTTDVTRTVHLGTPTEDQRICYTLVLKAHIALAKQIFPSNTAGSKLDTLARRIMWQFQCDYAHGTGHGVGAFLQVHEGPIGISGNRLGNLQLMGLAEPGILENMVVTIEPGYYLTNQFGIRLENVVFVVPAQTCSHKNDLMVQVPTYSTNSKSWLSFEPVTLVPFQPRLIDTKLLTKSELNWLNNYHSRVRQILLDKICCEANRINQNQASNSNLDPSLWLSNLTPSRQRCAKWLIKSTEPLEQTLSSS